LSDIRRKRWRGHVAHKEKMTKAYRIVVGKPQGKKPFGRPRHRREYNIMFDLMEIRSEDVD
jgi:hypothetical protein